jgi:hypothetical protein
MTLDVVTFEPANALRTTNDVPSMLLHQNVEWAERETIRRALAIAPRKHQAAKLMGISPRALSHYLAKHRSFV